MWYGLKDNGITKRDSYHDMFFSYDLMLAPIRRHDSWVETLVMILISVKGETQSEIHLLSFSNTSTRIIHLILREITGNTINLDKRESVWGQLFYF